jgi:hypothetical protein
MAHEDPEKKKAYNKAYAAAHKKERRLYQKSYRATHSAEIRAYDRSYKSSHRDVARAYELKKLYDLTPPEFDFLLAMQGGACAICSKDSFGAKGPVVDHSHVTGSIRGIVCGKCNQAAGLLGDSPDVARSLANYLEVSA